MSQGKTPVLVGVAQVDQRLADFREAKEPLALMIDAVRLAAEDAGVPELCQRAESLQVIRGLWPYKNPAKVVAESVGCPEAETVLTQFGGNFVQTATNYACASIAAGERHVVIITGAECGYSQAKARKAGTRPEWQPAPGTPDRWLGEDEPMVHEFELARGLRQPIQFYPMFENALRAARGESIQAHLERISRLWAGFAEVARGNPHAAIKDGPDAETIRTLSPSNRPISFPYPKLMNSNNSVDMGAALILTNTETARALGIDERKWVYPHVGTDAHDTYAVSHRDRLYESPAIRTAGRRALELAGLSPNEIDHVDVYSCFPVAVQVGASEIGLGLERPLTVTGGLTFNGGPLNNYVMHSIARMAEILRDQPGDVGLITANGGFLTKHAFGVYSTTPPKQPYRHQDCQHEVDAYPRRELDTGYTGEVTIEGYTVMYGADGRPDTAFAALQTPEGRRTWGSLRDAEVMQAMTEEEFCGRAARVDDDGRFGMV